MAKKPKNKKLTKKKLRKLAVEVQSLVAREYSDSEICAELEIRPSVLKKVKVSIYQSTKVELQSIDRYVVYNEYRTKCRQMIKDLDAAQKRAKNRGQLTAVVAAVKLKKDIEEGMIRMGQEFGFVEKKPTEIEVKSEVSFNTMSDEDMQKKIDAEVAKMHRIANDKVINMRPELLDGITSDDVQSYVPDNLVRLPEPKAVKVKHKVSFRKRV